MMMMVFPDLALGFCPQIRRARHSIEYQWSNQHWPLFRSFLSPSETKHNCFFLARRFLQTTPSKNESKNETAKGQFTELLIQRTESKTNNAELAQRPFLFASLHWRQGSIICSYTVNWQMRPAISHSVERKPRKLWFRSKYRTWEKLHRSSWMVSGRRVLEQI